MNTAMNGISLFTGAGIGEVYLEKLGINICVANEVDEKRANLYKKLHPETRMIVGDITNDQVFNNIVKSMPKSIDLIIATPPCQGVSKAGKNRSQNQMVEDKRNYLILEVIKLIKIKNPRYVLIENVPDFLKIKLKTNKKLITIEQLLNDNFSEDYEITSKIIDAADLGIPQHRKRAIIKMYPKGTKWPWPQKESHVTVRDAIGDLPSLESGQKSEIPFHYARKHTKAHVLAMKNTSTDNTAHDNEIYYPKNKKGLKVKGYNTTYRRMSWDRPAPTITIRSDAISSQRNVHPGNIKSDGTYSDARVLTLLELFILMGLPSNLKIPLDTSEVLIRQCIGEGVPPIMISKIFMEINNT